MHKIEREYLMSFRCVASIPDLTFICYTRKAWNDVLAYLNGGIAKRLTDK